MSAGANDKSVSVMAGLPVSCLKSSIVLFPKITFLTSKIFEESKFILELLSSLRKSMSFKLIDDENTFFVNVTFTFPL